MAKSKIPSELRQALRAELEQEKDAFAKAKLEAQAGKTAAIAQMKKHAQEIANIKRQLEG